MGKEVEEALDVIRLSCPFEEDYNTIKSAIEQKEKLEKALEIIDDMNFIPLNEIKSSKNFDEYYKNCLAKGILSLVKTNEQYNLLKEMLK